MKSTIYKRMLRLVLPHWRHLGLGMICMVGFAGSTAGTAYLIKPVLDEIFVNRDAEKLKILPWAILLFIIVKGFSQWGNLYFMQRVGHEIIARLRQQIYDHIQTLSLAFFDRTPTGILMSRVTNDVAQIQGAVSGAITGVLKEAFSIVGLLFVVFYRDWELALIATMVLPFTFYPIVRFGKMLRGISKKSQQSIGDISVILHETIGGSRIVKAFCMEEYEKKRFEAENAKYLRYAIKSVSVSSLSSPIMEFLGGIGVVLIIWYGGSAVIRGVSTPGNFFSFLAALLMLYEPVKRLNQTNNTLQQGAAAALRVYEILDMDPDIQDRPGAISLSPVSRSIEFRHVDFRYGDDPVLRDINLKVTAGEIIALVGASGAGKTTLVNLIPRFYEVTDGAILMDGIDVRDVTLASLRAQIGIVTQQTILFNDTIRNNIAYGSMGTSEEAVVAAARAANAYDFIMRLPHGFDTIIGEQGVMLSGGERQRICIARALLKNSPILILDEATSSLDSESELEVQKALETLMKGRTTFVIAHRLSTIKNADRIIALSNGAIVEEGCHEELLQRDSEYRRLYELQFSQYESAQAPTMEEGNSPRRAAR